MADFKLVPFRVPIPLYTRLQKLCEKRPGEKGWTRQAVLLRALMHELPQLEQEAADQPRDQNEAKLAQRKAFRERKAKKERHLSAEEQKVMANTLRRSVRVIEQ